MGNNKIHMALLIIGGIMATLICETNGWLHDRGAATKQLESRVRDLETTIAELRDQIKTIRQDNGYTTKPRAKRVTMLGTLGARYAPPPSTFMNIPDIEVGFHVSLSSTTTITANNNLQFDKVHVNIGGAFDKTSGVFTAPLAGTYLFSVSIVCDTGSLLHAAVYNNETPTLNTLCDSSKGTMNQGGGTTIMKLGRGEKVSVRIIWPNSGTTYGNGMTSFSGYRLHA